MKPELMIVLAFVIVGGAMIARQRLRLARLAAAWSSLSERQGWRFVPPRGPWYDRRDFQLLVPSSLGVVEVSWNPGYRGSAETTRFARKTPEIADSSVLLDGQVDPELACDSLPTGDSGYDGVYRASSRDTALLAAILDGELRRDHLAAPCDVRIHEGELVLSAAGFVDDEAAFLDLLGLSDAWMRRILDHTGMRVVD